MLGLNYLAWAGIVSWVIVPLLAWLAAWLIWRRSHNALSKAAALAAGFAILSTPLLISNGVKAHYDRQVRELCAKDGGVRVYETVRLPPEKFDEFGDFRIPIKSSAQETDPYYYEWRIQYYREGNPSIERSHFLIFRRVDKKLLGEAISYARLRGDLPGPWEGGTSFRCPRNSNDSILHRRVFIQMEMEGKK
jgi:hypothetical protein